MHESVYQVTVEISKVPPAGTEEKTKTMVHDKVKRVLDEAFDGYVVVGLVKSIRKKVPSPERPKPKLRARG